MAMRVGSCLASLFNTVSYRAAVLVLARRALGGTRTSARAGERISRGTDGLLRRLRRLFLDPEEDASRPRLHRAALGFYAGMFSAAFYVPALLAFVAWEGVAQVVPALVLADLTKRVMPDVALWAVRGVALALVARDAWRRRRS